MLSHQGKHENSSERSAPCDLGHEKQRTLNSETDLIEFDDVGMVQHLHDLNFPVDLLQVYSVQLGLVNNLNGHLQCISALTV